MKVVLKVFASCFLIFLIIASIEYGKSAIKYSSAEAAVIPIEESWNFCKSKKDCILVHNNCDGCCKYQVINRSKKPDYDRVFVNTCSNYSGPVCDCAYSYGYEMKCENDKCVFNECTEKNKSLCEGSNKYF